MQSVPETERQWVGVRRAAEVAGLTHYSVQKAAVAGRIRSRSVPPFATVFYLPDVQALAESLQQRAIPVNGPRLLQPA